MQNIIVQRGKDEIFNLDKEVFELLFDSTVVRRDKKFDDALKFDYIDFDKFIKLSRDGEVPYPLFFLGKSFAEQIIEDYNKQVYCGVSKEQLSISSRGDITLADITLIIKDITRKQNFLKKIITDKNKIVGLYAKTDKNIIQQAQEIRNLIDYNIDKISGYSKERSFNTFSDGLAKHHVFISLYVDKYSPQRINKKLQFSGIAIKDKACPYLFIKAGDNDSAVELWGRRLFTAALLLSCLLHADCRPVTMDGNCRDLVSNEHYQFAEELLMPEDMFLKETCSTINDVDSLSSKYSVSPSAILMRLYSLKMIDSNLKNELFDIIETKWTELKNKPHGKKKEISTQKALIRYNNKTVVKHIYERFKSGKIDEQMAKKLLCYKKGETFNIMEFNNV